MYAVLKVEDIKCTMTGNCCYSRDSLYKYSYIATIYVINIRCTITIELRHKKTFVVLLKTTKMMEVELSESFHVHSACLSTVNTVT